MGVGNLRFLRRPLESRKRVSDPPDFLNGAHQAYRKLFMHAQTYPKKRPIRRNQAFTDMINNRYSVCATSVGMGLVFVLAYERFCCE